MAFRNKICGQKSINLLFMESFIIHTKINDRLVDLLVIPDDCNSHSIFHLVKNETEINKIKYSEAKQWEIVDGDGLSSNELKEITQKIEEFFLEA